MIKKIVTYSFLIISCFKFEILDAQDKEIYKPLLNKFTTFYTYKYPANIFPTLHKSHCDNDFIAVPLENGVCLAGWDSWILKIKDFYVTGVYLCKENKTVYSTLYNERNSGLYRLDKIVDIDTIFKETLLKDLGSGIYTLGGKSKDCMFIWGCDSTHCTVSIYDGINVIEIYNSEVPITDICYSQSGYALATNFNGAIYLLALNEKPVLIANTGLKLNGIEIASDGSLFLSCDKGIFRMYSLDDLEDVELIANVINGPLLLRNDRLYVDWIDQSMIFRIDLLK
ncbi:MAG: hypothetical protein IPL69_15045 [Saprospiraceae bacterium]|nr:hypothetical protein [Candidatus Brachybacter algidus]